MPQERRFTTLLRRASCVAASSPPHEHSFFLSLTFPTLINAPLPASLWTNVDCVELRADLLTCIVDGSGSIPSAIASLQREIAT